MKILLNGGRKKVLQHLTPALSSQGGPKGGSRWILTIDPEHVCASCVFTVQWGIHNAFGKSMDHPQCRD